MSAAAGALPPLVPIEVVGRHMLKLGKIWRVSVAELVPIYHEALSDLTPRECDLAFAEVIKRARFFPNPSEIRDALEAALERMPRIREADPDCKACEGGGWKVVEVNGRTFAVQCDCRRRRAESGH